MRGSFWEATRWDKLFRILVLILMVIVSWYFAGVRAGEMDLGLAWCESSRAVDPDLKITLGLVRKIRSEGKK
jgi:hypothetical protein